MKPLWVQTLLWILAILAALLLALVGPEGSGSHGFDLIPHGANAPR
jgi:hypothetical protein